MLPVSLRMGGEVLVRRKIQNDEKRSLWQSQHIVQALPGTPSPGSAKPLGESGENVPMRTPLLFAFLLPLLRHPRHGANAPHHRTRRRRGQHPRPPHASSRVGEGLRVEFSFATGRKRPVFFLNAAGCRVYDKA